ncbi:hypothetical protein Anas_08566 [Armadillidium nasatum]|uniref:Platelet-derived growth factor (PDGF) family profile domain-containing protein n=1 Tax=Armadillidium nasatum TaxID=96803 RepID=A0A5N5T5W2_9CRUS|nr:hypothetical protein Anas_08566 [Armadillidium nasatum]
MNSPSVISLLFVFQIILDATNAGTIIPGITTVDYFDYVDDYYHGNTSIVSGKMKTGMEENVVEIPKEVFNKIGSFNDLSELQKILGIVAPPEKVFSIFRNSPLDEDVTETRSRKTVKYIGNPKQAQCVPELHSVDLGLINTPDVTYYPTCVRVNQCGGCCPSKDIISCQPIASEKVVVQVYELFPNAEENDISTSASSTRGRRRRQSVKVKYNKINVTVEEHKECACLCKLRESSCNLDVHFYDEKGCACICRNIDEEEKCYRKSTHFWNKDTCECLCRHEIACSSSETFDHSSCT